MNRHLVVASLIVSSSVSSLAYGRQQGLWEVRGVTPEGKIDGDGGGRSPTDPDARKPVYIKIGDNNLLKIVENNGLIEFYKTSEGYAEYGAKGQVAGVGASADWSEGRVFLRVSAMEVAALFDHDWQKISKVVYEQYKVLPKSTTAQAGAIFYFLTVPLQQGKLFSPQTFLSSTEGPGANLDPNKDVADNIISTAEEGRVINISSRLSRYFIIRLPDYNLMRVEQSGNTLSFSVTSSGYGVKGGEVNAFGNGGGVEVPTALTYTHLEPLAALALLDRDWRTIYNAAEKHSKIFQHAVDPQLVQQTLQPLIEGRYTGPGTAPLVSAFKVDFREEGRKLRQELYTHDFIIYPSIYFSSEAERLNLIVDTAGRPREEVLENLQAVQDARSAWVKKTRESGKNPR